jgi:hypothetical protein
MKRNFTKTRQIQFWVGIHKLRAIIHTLTERLRRSFGTLNHKSFCIYPGRKNQPNGLYYKRVTIAKLRFNLQHAYDPNLRS